MNDLMGQTVHWYPHADKSAVPCPAIVVGQRRDALTLNVIRQDSATMRTLHGVLHVSDPQLKRLEDNAVVNGGWDLLPSTKAIHERLDALAACVAELTDAMTLSK
jgi:hypothetical protein